MKIAIGADHRGFELKKQLTSLSVEIEWTDCGAPDGASSDYPVFAKAVCQKIFSGDADCGVLICGSGVGMSVAANRNKGIFAALCWCSQVAAAAKQDDNANILVLPADYLSLRQAQAIFDSWIKAEFKGGKYEKRLKMID